MSTHWITSAQLRDEAPGDATLLKGFTAEKLEETGAPRRLRFVISTGDIDRDNDVIDPAGWDLGAYKQNPVVLWAHSHSELPIGRAVEIGIENGKLVAVAEFADHPLAETVYSLLKNGFLRATSVGFRAVEWNLNEERRGIDFKRQELLEFSVVPVPANAHALIAAELNGTDLEPMRKWVVDVLAAWPGEIKLPGKARAAIAEKPKAEPKADDHGVWERLDKIESTLRDLAGFMATHNGPAVHGATTVSASTHGITLQVSNDPEPEPEAKGRIPRDVSTEMAERSVAWAAPTLGDFTEASWDDLSDDEKERIAGHFAWSASMPSKSFEDLKLPHHRPSDGAVVFRGVAAAAARLTQTDMPDEDVASVRLHLAKHYEQFDMTPPWQRASDAGEGVEQWEACEADIKGLEAQTDVEVSAVLRSYGYADEADAVYDDMYIELADTDTDEAVLELTDEPEGAFGAETLEDLRSVLSEVVAEGMAQVVRDQAEHALNKIRGRVN